jgi:hypothetical protein
MNAQLTLTTELEVTADLLRFHLERAVSRLDVPLEIKKPLPLKLGRLRGGRVAALQIEPGALRVELIFERGYGVTMHLSDVQFQESDATLSLTLERLNVTGFIGAGIIGALRGVLLNGATRGVNARFPGALSTGRGNRLELHLEGLLMGLLSTSEPQWREALTPLLPLEPNARVSVLGFALLEGALWLRVRATV